MCRNAEAGFIPQSVHAPRGVLNFGLILTAPILTVFAEDKKFILHCASIGLRGSGLLLDMGFEGERILPRFSGWVEAGGAVKWLSHDRHHTSMKTPPIDYIKRTRAYYLALGYDNPSVGAS